MTADEEKAALARLWLEKAEESLAAARVLSDRGMLALAVGRLYYAAFYAVSGVLAERGKAYGRHSAVRASLHRDFVHPGIVPRWCGELYDGLFDDRQDADYAPIRKFEPQQVSERLAQTGRFLEVFRGLVTRA
jgi:uncharacterized protein (UPF0332 family)